MQKDVKFNGTNSTTLLESTKVSKNELETNSKRSAKTCCKCAKKPKRTEAVTPDREVRRTRIIYSNFHAARPLTPGTWHLSITF
jgi:hypothetical protein